MHASRAKTAVITLCALRLLAIDRSCPCSLAHVLCSRFVCHCLQRLTDFNAPRLARLVFELTAPEDMWFKGDLLHPLYRSNFACLLLTSLLSFGPVLPRRSSSCVLSPFGLPLSRCFSLGAAVGCWPLPHRSGLLIDLGLLSLVANQTGAKGEQVHAWIQRPHNFQKVGALHRPFDPDCFNRVAVLVVMRFCFIVAPC
jgi:hypothetical protein